MASNLNEEQPPISTRSEILPTGHDNSDRKRNCKSPLKALEPVRSASRRVRSALPNCCARCKIPLLIDANGRETSNRSPASATSQSERLCQECRQERARSSSSRIFKSASVNWSHMGGKIGTWFEKARTPDQRVVYNFLEQLNDEKTKKVEKSPELTRAESLNDVLNGLKKYQARFRSANPRNKFTRAFESSSWRVLRHPSESYEFTQPDPVYGDQATRDMCIGSVFAPTNRRIRSTFLIHPDWV
ncbi:unnamed protein product [Rotaria socialis]|uniref:Uncharacterized protein n=1 Tax=Rotaria socialis TaxID=392032 RepID=A0A817T370_9BILA|nr:unnamed protein product [Rotaria socialis]CAF4179795.1 unnamed protein product [Rotaria socialis]